jgi:hypothetical protein
LGDRFEITVESVYLPNDRGDRVNALNLPNEILKKCAIEILNIAKDQVDDQDFASENDPSIFHSFKTNRGPLNESWIVILRDGDKLSVFNNLFRILLKGQ